MNVCEAHKVRHLVLRLDRGDELPAALVRALSTVEARSAFISAVGALEAVELTHYDPTKRAYGRARRLETSCEVASLSGNVAVLDGAASVRLSGVFTRESNLGLVTFGGQVAWARVLSLEVQVTVLDDVALTRVADERSGLPVLDAKSIAPPRAPAPAAPAAPSRSEPEREPREASSPTPAPAPAPLVVANPIPLPKPPVTQPVRRDAPIEDEPEEEFPNAGDVVVHFHFGECLVVGSSGDGDRIRIRQDKPGSPVLDVSLSKLRVELLDRADDGKRRFKLHRKN